MTSSEVRDFPAHRLSVDPDVQRQVSPARVRKIAADWDDLMVGVLTVSHRLPNPLPLTADAIEGGEFVVLDGQTRLAAFRLVCSEATVAPLKCQVYEGLTRQEEAQIFLKHNDRRAIQPRDRYRLALVAREEWALDIGDIAGKFGWHVSGTGRETRRFSAVGAAEKVYFTDSGIALRKTFETVDAAWRNARGSVTSETLYGLGLFFAEHGENIDTSSLSKRLGKLGFNAYISGVNDRRRANPGTSIMTAAPLWTADLYNSGRRTHRL